MSIIYFFIATNSFAQTPTSTKTIILADINLSNITILSQEGQNFRIAVDIVNNADETQSDIKLGVELVKKTENGQTKVATFVLEDILTVGANQTLHKEFSYQAPSALSGNYDLWVMGRMTSGLMLGLGSAGEVSLSGISEYVEIVSESCFLSVAGEDKKYTLIQGVDASNEETLALKCVVKNHFSRDITMLPSFKTHERVMYGPLVDITYQPAPEIVLKPNETKELSFIITKPEKPQAYDVEVALIEKTKNVPVSAGIVAHYVLRGASATIQNASLDKTTYQKGEIITASIFWSPSADSFQDSRAGSGTNIASIMIKISITDRDWNECVAPIIKQIDRREIITKVSATALINCNFPKLTASIVDGNGAVLDNKEFLSPKDDVLVIKPIRSDDTSGTRAFFAVIVIALLVISAVIIRKKIILEKNV